MLSGHVECEASSWFGIVSFAISMLVFLWLRMVIRYYTLMSIGFLGKLSVWENCWRGQGPDIESNTQPGRDDFDPHRTIVGRHSIQGRVAWSETILYRLER